MIGRTAQLDISSHDALIPCGMLPPVLPHAQSGRAQPEGERARRVASLFSLRGILDKAGAFAAYQGSPRLRPHPVVEVVRRKLELKLADALRFVPRAMRR